MTTNSIQSGHSSRVEMRLVVGDSSLRVAQLGPGRLLLEEPAEHPPTAAEFHFAVDQQSRRWRVLLPDGISRSSLEVRMTVATA